MHTILNSGEVYPNSWGCQAVSRCIGTLRRGAARSAPAQAPAGPPGAQEAARQPFMNSVLSFRASAASRGISPLSVCGRRDFSARPRLWRGLGRNDRDRGPRQTGVRQQTRRDARKKTATTLWAALGSDRCSTTQRRRYPYYRPEHTPPKQKNRKPARVADRDPRPGAITSGLGYRPVRRIWQQGAAAGARRGPVGPSSSRNCTPCPPGCRTCPRGRAARVAGRTLRPV